MASVFDAITLWVVDRKDSVILLAQGEDGFPEPVQEYPTIYRAVYLSPEAVENEVNSRADFTNSLNYQLLIRGPDSEAPPITTARLYHFQETSSISCRIGRELKYLTARRYSAALKVGATYSWNNDLLQGKRGYFQVGGIGDRNLWRVQRAEADFANRLIFTLTPVVPSNGLPALDLQSVQSEVLKQQIADHWREFVEVYSRQLPLRSVNAAKDVCEFLLRDVLRRIDAVKQGRGEFGECLKELFLILDSDRRESVPFTLLHYHLMQKIRLLHGDAHARKVERHGPISPELGLSIANDLVVILKAAGLVGPL